MSTCFIIMPISTPESRSKGLASDPHFEDVRENYFEPAVRKAGFEPIGPSIRGTALIIKEIVIHLTTADLVLCDMSTLNPNVLFEFGIRVAVNKPVALVKDDRQKETPFDIRPLNCLDYPFTPNWRDSPPDLIDKLAGHLSETMYVSHGRNPLWEAVVGDADRPCDSRGEKPREFLASLFPPAQPAPDHSPGR